MASTPVWIAPSCRIAEQDRRAPARAPPQGIGGHVVHARRALVAVLQVAEFPAQVHAALAHDRGVEGGIAVRRDVPVVGHRKLDAVDVVQPEGRRQEARLALVRQREAERREAEHRQVLEAQHRALGPAHFFFHVEPHGGGAQDPVGHPAGAGLALAGGVGGVVDHRALVIQEVHARGLAVRLVLQESVARLAEEALEGLDLELQQRAFVDVAAAVHVDVAARLGQVVGLVVLEPVGADHRAGAAQLGIALDDGLQVRAAGAAVAGDERRRRAPHGLGNLFLQLRRGLEHERRLGLLRDGRGGLHRHAGPGHQPCQRRRGKTGPERQALRILRRTGHRERRQTGTVGAQAAKAPRAGL
jgi:hypothetical protein